MIEIVPISDLYKILNKDSDESLWNFLESDIGQDILSNEQIVNIKNWINLINYKMKNESNFFNNLKEVFTQNGKCHLIEGQEDRAAIRYENECIIIRHCDFGVNFAIYSEDKDLKSLTKEQWNNFEKMLSALDVGFVEAKNFHLLNNFDKMNNELKINNSINKKIKV